MVKATEYIFFKYQSRKRTSWHIPFFDSDEGSAAKLDNIHIFFQTQYHFALFPLFFPVYKVSFISMYTKKSILHSLLKKKMCFYVCSGCIHVCIELSKYNWQRIFKFVIIMIRLRCLSSQCLFFPFPSLLLLHLQIKRQWYWWGLTDKRKSEFQLDSISAIYFFNWKFA